MTEPTAPAGIDTTRAHPARVYDYWIGGKNHFAADREAGEAVMTHPAARTGPRENRAFLGRAVRYLATEAGIRQFLDIGSGLPATGNVHEIAQRAAPESRVVYVDNDPLVHVHAQALLTSSAEGRTAYIQADLREPRKILEDSVTRDVLNFDRPVGLVLAAVLHFIPDDGDPRTIVKTLVDALPPGSYLVASHGSGEHIPDAAAEGQGNYRNAGVQVQLRDSGDFARLAFDGLDLVPPGVVLVSEWRNDAPGNRPLPDEVNIYGGVARKR